MIDTAPILLADDSPDDAARLRRAFQLAGWANPVQHVGDGAAAIQFLNSRDPQSEAGLSSPPPLLLLLDLNMPRGDGFAVLDWLRQQPQLRSLPTIVLSDSARQADIENSFRLGAHAYWVKPSRLEDLVQLAKSLGERLQGVAHRVEMEYPVELAVGG